MFTVKYVRWSITLNDEYTLYTEAEEEEEGHVVILKSGMVRKR